MDGQATNYNIQTKLDVNDYFKTKKVLILNVCNVMFVSLNQLATTKSPLTTTEPTTPPEITYPETSTVQIETTISPLTTTVPTTPPEITYPDTSTVRIETTTTFGTTTSQVTTAASSTPGLSISGSFSVVTLNGTSIVWHDDYNNETSELYKELELAVIEMVNIVTINLGFFTRNVMLTIIELLVMYLIILW